MTHAPVPTPAPAPARTVRDYALPSRAAGRPRRWRRRALACLLATDAGAGGLAAMIALVRPGGPGDGVAHLPLALLAGLAWPVVLAAGGVYELRRTGHGNDEFRRVMLSGVALLALLSTAGLAGATLPGAEVLQRALTLLGVPLATGGSLLAHLAGRAGLLVMRGLGRCRYRAVVVGQERSVAELIRSARRDPAAGLDVVGACLTSVRRAGARGAEIDGVPVLGRSADVAAAVARLNADTVLISAWSDLGQEELRQLTWDLEGSGVELLVAPRLTGVTAPRLHVRTVSGSPLVHVREPELSGFARGAKAGSDLVLALLLLVLLSPVLAVLALAVRIGSPGPVLFRQERIGLGGRPFRMTKFRSMHVGAEHVVPLTPAGSDGDDEVQRGPLFKLRDDPRVTRVGRFIRRFSLDELPQLLDVVAGRMSLVGPRPQLPHEVAQYEGEVRRRLRVRPGMTGLWQVSGRSDLSWSDAVRLDLHYVENWSLAGDLAIMARTVVTVLSRSGAY